MSRISLERVDDYTNGLLGGDEAARFEEELFDAVAEGPAPALAFADTMRRIAPWFAPRGGFVTSIPRARHDSLREAPHVCFLELAVNRPVEVPAWPADTELVTYRIGVDLRGYEDVVVHLELADGTPLKVFRDVGYEPSDGAIYAVCDVPIARAVFGYHARSRIEATRDGKRVTVATVETKPAR